MEAERSLPNEPAQPGDSPRRFLDPFEEWRDCANRWEMSDLWAKHARPGADPGPARNEGEQFTE